MVHHKPYLTQAGRIPTFSVAASNENNQPNESEIAGEWPLTIYLDKREIVTLMTNGAYPEYLALGYLKNQHIIDNLAQVQSVQVDWDVEAAVVSTHSPDRDLDEKLSRRTVTTGCGQGTIFGDLTHEIANTRLHAFPLSQSVLYALLDNLSHRNAVYRKAGAVHGCALCKGQDVLYFVEDVGRHNAVDTIAGMMWVDGLGGEDMTFYTTGRLTSEMVIKVVQMRIPVLISRSGITKMGLDLAIKTGVTLIARAKGRHFLIYHGIGDFLFDVKT